MIVETDCFMSQHFGFFIFDKGMITEFASPPPPILCFTCFECDLLAEEHACLCVLGFIPEVLGTDLGHTATTGNGKFCNAFYFNKLYAFREILTELLNQDKDALM